MSKQTTEVYVDSVPVGNSPQQLNPSFSIISAYTSPPSCLSPCFSIGNAHGLDGCVMLSSRFAFPNLRFPSRLDQGSKRISVYPFSTLLMTSWYISFPHELYLRTYSISFNHKTKREFEKHRKIYLLHSFWKGGISVKSWGGEKETCLHFLLNCWTLATL